MVAVVVPFGPNPRDLKTLSHECFHALQAYREGHIPIYAVIVDDDGDGQHGETAMRVPRDATLESRARVTLAGNVGQWHGDASYDDEQYALALWAMAGNPPGWLDERCAELRTFLGTRDARACWQSLYDAGRVARDLCIRGDVVERICAEYLT